MEFLPQRPFAVGEIYADRVGAYKVISMDGGRLIFEYVDGVRGEGDIGRKALIYRNILLEQTARIPNRFVRHSGSDWRADTQFNQDEIFPMIARIIQSKCHAKKGYLTHDMIVRAMLEHPEAGRLISNCPNDERKTAAWWAHNMLAWFSQRITVGESAWRSVFDRKSIDGKWAYKFAGENRKRSR